MILYSVHHYTAITEPLASEPTKMGNPQKWFAYDYTWLILDDLGGPLFGEPPYSQPIPGLRTLKAEFRRGVSGAEGGALYLGGGHPGEVKNGDGRKWMYSWRYHWDINHGCKSYEVAGWTRTTMVNVTSYKLGTSKQGHGDC